MLDVTLESLANSGLINPLEIIQSNPEQSGIIMAIVGVLMSVLKSENFGFWKGSLFNLIPDKHKSKVIPFLYSIVSILVGSTVEASTGFMGLVSYLIAGFIPAGIHSLLYQEFKHTKKGDIVKKVTTDLMNALFGMMKRKSEEKK